jgi:hypothetical protein
MAAGWPIVRAIVNDRWQIHSNRILGGYISHQIIKSILSFGAIPLMPHKLIQVPWKLISMAPFHSLEFIFTRFQ